MSAFALLPLFLTIFPGSHGDEPAWPNWNGPERDGRSRETAWVAAGKQDPLWTLELGLGYSSVAIGGGRLYTLGFDKQAGLDIVWCLDAESGEVLWTHDYEAKIWDQAHTGGTLTTPAIDGDVVFILNREANMYCLRADTGEVVWHQNYFEEEQLEYPTWGFAASPLVLDDQVIMNLGKVFSLDKESGEVLWVTERNYGHAYSTPTLFEQTGEQAGEPALAVFNGDGLAVLSLDGGMPIAFHGWETKYDMNCASPIVLGERIYISSGQGKGNALLQLSEDGLAPLWENKEMGNKMSGCVLIDDHFYGFDEAVLKCLDLEGRVQWAERGIGNGALAAAADKLIVVGAEGELIVAAATPSGFSPLSKTQALANDGVFWTKPAIAGGLIYARGSLGQLVCLDHRAPRSE